MIFFFFTKMYVVVLIRRASLMSTHNICFCVEVRKILCGYTLLSGAMFIWWANVSSGELHHPATEFVVMLGSSSMSTRKLRAADRGIWQATRAQLLLGWPQWLSWMRVWLETRRSWVQPPPWLATFFRGDWSWNIFYCHSLPSADSRWAVVSFWRKNAHNG